MKSFLTIFFLVFFSQTLHTFSQEKLIPKELQPLLISESSTPSSSSLDEKRENLLQLLQDKDVLNDFINFLQEKGVGNKNKAPLPAKPFVENKLLNPEEIPLLLSKVNWQELFIKLVRICFVIMITIFIWRISTKGIQHYVSKLPFMKEQPDLKKNSSFTVIKTLMPILISALHWGISILSILIILSELGINITPIIFSFSVLGLGFSIGSQNFVKDIINGFVTLIEGNVAVGEIVTIGDSTGTVESMSLRSISLRHFTGEIQNIPFSEVKTLINISRDFSVASISFYLKSNKNIQEIENALQDTYESMKNDHEFSHYIRGPLSRVGISEFTPDGIRISCSVPLIPDPKKSFIKQFNYRFCKALEQQNVYLSFQK